VEFQVHVDDVGLAVADDAEGCGAAAFGAEGCEVGGIAEGLAAGPVQVEKSFAVRLRVSFIIYVACR
jgi:hypothetical protein